MVGPQPSLGGSHPQLMMVVAAELRRRILDIELEPGEHLAESRLAAELGVSRNPVREAIRILSAEGFVEIQPRRGAFVAQCTPDDAEHIFEVRLVLEPLGARLAAQHITAAGLADLDASISRAKSAMEAGELDVLADLNTEFHVLVMEHSQNPYLSSIAAPAIKRAQWIYRQNAATRAPHSWSEHAGLIEAIRDRDPVAAEAEARTHVATARRSFRARIGGVTAP